MPPGLHVFGFESGPAHFSNANGPSFAVLRRTFDDSGVKENSGNVARDRKIIKILHDTAKVPEFRYPTVNNG